MVIRHAAGVVLALALPASAFAQGAPQQQVQLTPSQNLTLTVGDVVRKINLMAATIDNLNANMLDLDGQLTKEKVDATAKDATIALLTKQRDALKDYAASSECKIGGNPIVTVDANGATVTCVPPPTAK